MDILDIIVAGTLVRALTNIMLYTDIFKFSSNGNYTNPNDIIINLDEFLIIKGLYELPFFYAKNVRFLSKYGITITTFCVSKSDLEIKKS
jgi:hypothetical protein